MRRQAFWTVLAAILGMVAVSAVLFYVATQPTTLKIAVGPPGSQNYRLIAVLAQLLSREKADVRLKLVPTEGSTTSAAAFESGGADLAVLRSDVATPLEGLGVVDLRREVVMLLAAPGTGVTSISDLKGKEVGIVSAVALNVALMRNLLAYYGTVANEVQLRPLDGESAGTELASGAVAAIMSVGVPTGRDAAKLDSRITEALGRPPLYIPVTEAPAIAARNPALEASQIVRGVFRGAPPHPPESIATIALTHRLIANKGVDEGVIASLTQQIFALRVAIEAAEPGASQLATPDSERAGALALHPGASAYYEGNVKSFFDRYGDAFYIGVMALSIGGSGLAAVFSYANARRPEPYHETIDRLLELLGDARKAETLADLDVADRQADEIFADALRHIAAKDFDHQQITTFALTLDQVRHVISEQRVRLSGGASRLALAAE